MNYDKEKRTNDKFGIRFVVALLAFYNRQKGQIINKKKKCKEGL